MVPGNELLFPSETRQSGFRLLIGVCPTQRVDPEDSTLQIPWHNYLGTAAPILHWAAIHSASLPPFLLPASTRAMTEQDKLRAARLLARNALEQAGKLAFKPLSSAK